MRISALLFVFCVLPGSGRALADRIDGPANIRSEIDGRVVYSLDDSVYVEAKLIDSDWYDVEVIAYVRSADATNSDAGATLRDGSKLYNQEWEIIGVVRSEVETPFLFFEGDWARVFVFGRTHRQNIRSASIAEEQLAALLDQGAGSRNALDPHLEEHRYRHWREDEELLAVNKYGLGAIGSPEHRIGLVFQQNRLVAVYYPEGASIRGLAAEPLLCCWQIAFLTAEAELKERVRQLLKPLELAG